MCPWIQSRAPPCSTSGVASSATKKRFRGSILVLRRDAAPVRDEVGDDHVAGPDGPLEERQVRGVRLVNPGDELLDEREVGEEAMVARLVRRGRKPQRRPDEASSVDLRHVCVEDVEVRELLRAGREQDRGPPRSGAVILVVPRHVEDPREAIAEPAQDLADLRRAAEREDVPGRAPARPRARELEGEALAVVLVELEVKIGNGLNSA